jgi:hypothetical protein
MVTAVNAVSGWKGVDVTRYAIITPDNIKRLVLFD